MAKQSGRSIRIIAGEWRGRRLPVLDKPGLRPTTDRVRETLFNWLSSRIAATRCLDLFAGTGALGFECLSRGAEFVQFVERDTEVSSALRKNIDRLECGLHSDCVTGQAVDYLQQSAWGAKKFDLVFIDPPFADGMAEPIIRLLDASGCLTSHALVYVETDSQTAQPQVPPHWQQYRSKVAGQSRFELYSLS